VATELAYLDSSALVRLVVEEQETEALDRRLAAGGPSALASSSLALLEVARAVRIRSDTIEATAAWHDLSSAVRLIDVDRGLLHRAAALASGRVRSLDAVHLASALRIEPDVVITYDARMADAARRLALRVEQPGA
jgi:predicted nucleic acid-binding protein